MTPHNLVRKLLNPKTYEQQISVLYHVRGIPIVCHCEWNEVKRRISPNGHAPRTQGLWDCFPTLRERFQRTVAMTVI